MTFITVYATAICQISLDLWDLSASQELCVITDYPHGLHAPVWRIIVSTSDRAPSPLVARIFAYIIICCKVWQ